MLWRPQQTPHIVLQPGRRPLSVFESFKLLLLLTMPNLHPQLTLFGWRAQGYTICESVSSVQLGSTSSVPRRSHCQTESRDGEDTMAAAVYASRTCTSLLPSHRERIVATSKPRSPKQAVSEHCPSDKSPAKCGLRQARASWSGACTPRHRLQHGNNKISVQVGSASR